MWPLDHIKKNAPPLVAMGIGELEATKTIFDLIQDIIRTNLLAKFNDDLKINVTSRVLTRFYYSHIGKNAPLPWWPYIIGMNLLTEFHEDRTINVASRVKNAPPLGSNVFQAKVTIFKLIKEIIGTNLLTMFHEDRKVNVASRVLTRKNAPPPEGHVFQPTGIIFELIQDIFGMNLQNKFHEDQTINVASRVKNAPPPWQPYIIGTNLLTKFHEDRKINVASRVSTRKNAPPPGGHVFQPTGNIFELIQDSIGMNLLTKFHEDQTINVASRVKNAPPHGSHVFKANVTIFKLIQDIIDTNLLTKFNENWMQMLTPHNAQRTTHDGQKAITKAHHEHIKLIGANFEGVLHIKKASINTSVLKQYTVNEREQKEDLVTLSHHHHHHISSRTAAAEHTAEPQQKPQQ
ncbi:hypothetical protein DPMN_117585 [Dreissena polymorpha]|uniref:Uncharacterized protein n=1 Tax=Dreissena polymorpha TaxID=45954 RepID=A0A9D4GLG0_DREPO|nr:hypothetical protein DPMN_117585 [Dreissena polymorpha]